MSDKEERLASLVEAAFKESADKALRAHIDLSVTDLDKLWRKSDAHKMLKTIRKEGV